MLAKAISLGGSDSQGINTDLTSPITFIRKSIFNFLTTVRNVTIASYTFKKVKIKLIISFILM